MRNVATSVAADEEVEGKVFTDVLPLGEGYTSFICIGSTNKPCLGIVGEDALNINVAFSITYSKGEALLRSGSIIVNRGNCGRHGGGGHVCRRSNKGGLVFLSYSIEKWKNGEKENNEMFHEDRISQRGR